MYAILQAGLVSICTLNWQEKSFTQSALDAVPYEAALTFIHERAVSILASGVWRAVVLAFFTFVHVFKKAIKFRLRLKRCIFVGGTLPRESPQCLHVFKTAGRYLSVISSRVILTFLTIAACESRLAFTRVAFRGEAIQARSIMKAGVVSASVLSGFGMSCTSMYSSLFYYIFFP